MWSRNNNEADNASDHLAQSMWLGELSRQWDSVTAQAILQQDFGSSEAASETLLQVAIEFFCDEAHLHLSE